MDLTCDNCRAVMHLADNRVPPNSTFRLLCPRCKKKFVVTAPTAESQAGHTIEVGTEPRFKELPIVTFDDLPEDFPGEIASLASGQSAALLGRDHDSASDGLIAILERMGYVVDVAVSVDQVLQRLRFNQYRILLLTEEIGGSPLERVREFIAGLNMSMRRDLFVVLIGERFKTADHMQAFSESVNLVLHCDDLRQLETALPRSLQDYERFYRVFMNCLIESGKKV